MKQLIVIFSLVFTILTSSFAQEITIQKNGKKHLYSFNESPVGLKDMFQIMEAYSEPTLKLKSARTQKTFSYITAISGGFVLGRVLGKAISGNYTDVLIDEIGVGAGLIGLTFMLDSGRKKQTKKAVDIYNSMLPTHSLNTNPTSFEFKISNNSVGIVVQF